MKRVGWRFRVLASAHAASAYGNYLNLIALSLFSYEVTGTAFGVGAVMALRLFSGFVAGLMADTLTTRITGKAVMICADISQGAVMAVLAVCTEGRPLLLLAAAAMALGAGNTLFTVALRSAVPVMVGQDARAQGNGLLVVARSLAMLLGFASAAPLIGLGGYALAFAVNAASFVVSGAALLALNLPTEDGVGARTPDDSGEVHSAGTKGGRRAVPTRDGRPWRVARALPSLLLGMVLLRAVDALASSSHNVALPVVAHATSAAQPEAYMARFWAAWAAGAVLAHLVLGRRRGEGAWNERAFALGTCAMALSFVAAFLGLPALGLVAATAAAGFADGWTEIVYTSRLQAAQGPQRGRLFGLSAAAEQIGFALGTVAASAALETLPALAVVGAFHGVALCGALAFLLFTSGRRGAARQRPSTSRREEEGSNGTTTGESALSGP
ncbi:MFS transporter [Streptomyces sp. NBC_01716]|uniref:MFS transporter n=1 Tax=Streptomyces sp. NBC_01716 TaxID=2975917 RepID=UPI002E321BAC|nr:MFS transporter [Streptomyces sp. NBC_01716]